MDDCELGKKDRQIRKPQTWSLQPSSSSVTSFHHDEEFHMQPSQGFDNHITKTRGESGRALLFSQSGAIKASFITISPGE